jgi:hypothetical protein
VPRGGIFLGKWRNSFAGNSDGNMNVQPALWILLMVLYGCETWSLTLREHRLRMFENTELRSIFGTKRYNVTGGWRKLHNGDLHNLYSMPSIIRMINQGGCDGQGTQHEGEKMNAYIILIDLA